MMCVCAFEFHSVLMIGNFQIVLRSQLQVASIDLVLGNDLAGGKVFLSPKVAEHPIPNVTLLHCEL